MPIFDADGHITETTEQVAKYLDDPYRQRSAVYGLYTSDGWDRRMGAMRRDFGAGMSAAEAADLSAAIDIDALRGYWDAVYEETRRFMQNFDFDTLAEPMDAAARRRAMDLLGPGGEPMRDSVERVWTTKRGYVNVMTLMDVYYHLDEADHVVRMLMPDRQFF